MSTSIGWTHERPSTSGRRIGLFQYMRLKNGIGRQFVLGYLWYTREDLELLRSKQHRLDLRVVGALRFAQDVTPQLIDETIGTAHVTGPLFASDDVKRALRAHIGNGSSSEAST